MQFDGRAHSLHAEGPRSAAAGQSRQLMELEEEEADAASSLQYPHCARMLQKCLLSAFFY